MIFLKNKKNLIKLFILCFLYLFSFSILADEKIDENKLRANYYFLKGINFYQKENKEEALKFYLAALNENPKDPIILRELGYLYSEIRDFYNAKRYYKESLIYDERNTNALQNLVSLALLEKNYAEAKTYLDTFIDKNAYSYLISKIRYVMLNNENSFLKQDLDLLIQKDEFYENNFESDLYEILDKYYDKETKYYILKRFYSKNPYNENLVLVFSKFLFENNDRKEAYEILKNFIASFNDFNNNINAILILDSFYEKDNNVSVEEKNNLKKLIKKFKER